MRDYRAIFDGVESTLIRVGSRNLSADKIRSNLAEFKRLEGRTFTDADYYWILVYVIFYSGFRAATVTAKLDLIRQHFPNYETVAGYGDGDIKRILDDTGMIRNRRKVQACIENAQTFGGIVREYGSFQAYVASFSPMESFENLGSLVVRRVLPISWEYGIIAIAQNSPCECSNSHFETQV